MSNQHFESNCPLPKDGQLKCKNEETVNFECMLQIFKHFNCYYQASYLFHELKADIMNAME